MQPLWQARIKRAALLYVHTQLIVTLVSLPILIAWGLPISAMSIVGNYVFSPLFSLFLMLSSLIFITELVCIPNGLLITALEWVTLVIHHLLSLGQKEWLFSFTKPSQILLLLLPIGVWLLVRTTILNTLTKQITALCLLLTFIVAYLSWPTLHADLRIRALPATQKKIFVIEHSDGSISLADRGFFNRKQNVPGAVHYELVPYLRQTFGARSINHLILANPSARSIEAAQELSKALAVRHIVLPPATLTPEFKTQLAETEAHFFESNLAFPRHARLS